MSRRGHASSRSVTAAVLAAALVVGCGLDIVGRPTTSEDDDTASPVPDVTATGEAPPPVVDRERASAPPEPPNEPLTLLSPSHPSGSLTFQRPINWTIGALDRDVPIHFTTDETTPTKDSPSRLGGRVDLQRLPDGARIQWIAGESDVVHSFDVHVDERLATETHSIVEDVRFDLSGGPVVRVPAGSTITGTASASVWNGTCPDCIDQVTLGIASAAACIVSVNPTVYPGEARENVTFAIPAPTTAGTYELRTGFTQQYRCEPDALGTSLGETQVGTIVVE